MAAEYMRASGRKVGEIMTPAPLSVTEDDSLDTVVEQMERHRVKRLPVIRGRQMVGIVSRANLMHALVSLARDDTQPAAGNDLAIRDRILASLGEQRWATRVNVVVKNGIAELWGAIMDDRERQALIVAAENISGVKKAHDHLVWVEPTSGMAFLSAEDETKAQAELHAESAG
jgi:CBS-domain-containing membrane protein